MLLPHFSQSDRSTKNYTHTSSDDRPLNVATTASASSSEPHCWPPIQRAETPAATCLVPVESKQGWRASMQLVRSVERIPGGQTFVIQTNKSQTQSKSYRAVSRAGRAVSRAGLLAKKYVRATLSIFNRPNLLENSVDWPKEREQHRSVLVSAERDNEKATHRRIRW